MANTKVTSAVIEAGAILNTHIASGAISSGHLSGINTGAVAEGSNLYYTDARARASISVTGGNLAYDSSTGVLQLTDNEIRDAISAGGNLSYNNSTGVMSYTTPTMYTDADAQGAITVTDAGGDGSLAYSGGTITYTGPSAAEVRAHLSAGNALSYSSGQFAVVAPTASGGTNTTALATTAFVQQEITTLIGGAPSTLNDLNELAAAINDDANYNTTLTTALATKLPLAGGTLTGNLTIDKEDPNINLSDTSSSRTLAMFVDNNNSVVRASGPLLLQVGSQSAITIDASRNTVLAGTLGSGAITSTGAIQGTYFSDGYITWNAAQINRYGAAIELQFTPTNTATLVKIGANGSYPTIFNAYNGNATFTGTLTTPTLITGAYGGSGSAGDGFRLNSTDLYGQIDASDKVRLTVNGDSFLNGGNVGIGTASPGSKLEVKSSGSTTNEIALVHSGNTVKIASLAQESSHGSLHLRANSGIDKVRLSAAGNNSYILDSNVGIGTTTPDHPLEVVGAISSADTGLQKATFANVGNNLVITANAGATNVTSHIIFKSSQSGGAAAERMRINNLGNVGINTSNPYGGTGVTSMTVNAANYPVVSLKRADSDIFQIFGYYNHTTLNTAVGYMQFDAGGSERMRINENGNVGIGVTPSTGWVSSTDFTALQIGSGLALWGRGSGDHERLGLTANLYHDGSAWKHLNTGRVTAYEQNDGKHIFNYHASQAAGTSVTPTTAMVIDASGNVGIGTGSPFTTGGASKLTVAGILSFGLSNSDMSYIRRQGAGLYAWQTYNSNNTGSIQLQPYGGNVGIGTVTPVKTLDVAANGASQGIHLNISGVGRLQMYADGNRNYFKGLSGNGHRFTTTGGANVEILNNGNVGIGVANPATALHIDGHFSFTKNGTTGNRYILIDGADATYAGTMNIQAGFGSTAAGGAIKLYAQAHATYPGSVWIGRGAGAAGDIMFGNGGTGPSSGSQIQMQLTSAGDLLIGNTTVQPSSNHSNQAGFGYDTSTAQLQIASTTNNAQMELSRNSANDGNWITFRKQGNILGNIGTYGGTLYIGSVNGGIMFNGTDIEPTTGGTARSNNTVSLGSDNYKFRDGKFANEVSAGMISAGWHSWGTSQAIFGQDRYNIRELNNLFYSANTRFSGYGTSSNVHAAMFDGDFNSGYTFAANTTTVVEIDSGYQLTYPAGYHNISFYHVYNQFTSISIEQYHSAGTYNGQWRACGTATDFRGSAGSGGRVLKIEGAGNNYVRKWRMTIVTGSASVNVTDWSHYLTRASGADNREYMPNHVGAQVTHSMTFRNSAKTVVGSIGVSNTATAFNQTSDYRLKENVTPITSAAESVKLLNPVKFNFIEDETNTLIDGFLAHEVSSIVPEAVTGEKDAVEPDELYLESDPLPEGVSIGDVKIAGGAVDPQQLDYTKLIPMLTAALQEALDRIEVLENQ